MLKSAIDNNYFEIVDLLLKDGRIDPSANNNYLIKRAINESNNKMVELLLKDNRVNSTFNVVELFNINYHVNELLFNRIDY
jgi:hypothetical protein